MLNAITKDAQLTKPLNLPKNPSCGNGIDQIKPSSPNSTKGIAKYCSIGLALDELAGYSLITLSMGRSSFLAIRKKKFPLQLERDE